MNPLQGYPEGSDITLLNTIYHREIDEKNKYHDYLDLIFRDNKTGIKHHETIESPIYDFYVINEDNRPPEQQPTPMFIERNKCEKVSVPYRQVEKTLAELSNNLDFFYDNIRNGNAYANKALHTAANYFMGSDMDIEDFYRAEFGKMYTNTPYTPKKAFFDIETNNKYCKGDFPEPGEVPVNAVTLINKSTNQIFTFLLREPDNPQIAQFESEMGPVLFQELKNFIIEKVGGPKKARKFGVDKLEPVFMFFDQEIDLLKMLFIKINELQPDFILAWNMAFDIPYIIARIKVLGYNPEDIMCIPRFEHKICRYYVDKKSKEVEEKGDFAQISAYTVYADQMIHFASRRKGQQKFESNALDDIGEALVGVKKLSWYHITTSFAQFPYLAYKLFVFYNIMDVIVQVCIESKADDVSYIFNSALINNTRYHKVHRQSVYLTNRFASEWYKDNLIIGNNVNKFNQKPDEKFDGALVGDPTHTNTYAKMILNNRPSNIAENMIDYDYKALYPNIMGENNIAPSTQIGMIKMYRERYYNVPYLNDKRYSTAGRFLDNMATQNIILFCSRYFNLATYKELINDVYEYEQYNRMIGSIRVTKNHLLNPIHFKDKIQPIHIYNKGEYQHPIRIVNSNKQLIENLQEDLKRSVIL